LPISVHMRDAVLDTYQIIKQYKRPDLLGVMHCYSGSHESMNDFIELNMYISLAGPVTFKNARVSKEVAVKVPLERLVIETDSPYLAPQPVRGKPNEPKYLCHIAREIAGLKGLSYEEVALATTRNAQRLFGL
ncbi:MAG: TatD family hydrolase, partial [Acholeplasmataceae bacterium]|nr:TatD family hydrolase [Acholeplasmataceae bacterium]